MARGSGQFALTFLLMFAIGLGVPISPLYASKMGASWLEIGFMGSAWGIVFTFSAFLTGRVSDRIGRRPVLAISSALSALAALLFLRATSVSELIAIRGLEGLAWACFWPPMEALATETSDADHVGRGIGLVTTVYGLGFAIGSFTGGFMTDFFGFPLTFLTYFVLATLSILPVSFVESPKRTSILETSSQGRLLRRLFSRGLVAGNILGASYTFGLASIMALLSVYASGFGISIFWIGIALSIFWIGRIFGAALAGTSSDRLGRRRVALTGLIVGSAGFAMIGGAPGLLYIVAGALLTGLSIGGIFPVNVALIADDIEPELRGAAMGFYEMICAIAFMAASAFGGVSAQLVSPRTPYALSTIVFVSCAFALAVLLRHHRRNASSGGSGIVSHDSRTAVGLPFSSMHRARFGIVGLECPSTSLRSAETIPAIFSILFYLSGSWVQARHKRNMLSLTPDNFTGTRLLDSRNVLAVFYANWCPFCRTFLKVFESTMKKRTDLLAALIDVGDEDNPLWEVFGVNIVPTLVGFREGTAVVRKDGAPGVGLGIHELEDALREMKGQ